MKPRIHFPPNYLIAPQHKITINLIGMGGTGSQVLTALARMHVTLVALGHPGLHVYAWDADVVTTANLGRQLFSDADLGVNKATCLIARVNRYFGLNWEAYPCLFAAAAPYRTLGTNITISCVDRAAARIDIADLIDFTQDGAKENRNSPTHSRYYWLDFGNSQRSGQAILGTLDNREQPASTAYETVARLPVVTKEFNLENINEEAQGPSCSLAEAIGKQDLFINSTLAHLGVHMLWKLFRDQHITYRGLYLNLETMAVNPIPL